MLEYHESWEVIDATKLNDYLDCPRKFFYSRVLGWQPEKLNNHIAFGLAWARLQEELRLGRWSQEALLNGIDAFMRTYRGEGFDEDSDALFEPKSPANAVKAAIEYMKTYKDEATQLEPLHIEISGTVSIGVGKDRHLCFRLDSIMKHKTLGIVSYEDKTTTSFRRQWIDQWQLSYQVHIYTHVLYSTYPRDMVYGVIINGVAFQKTKIEFMRIPSRISIDMMETWIHEVNRLFDRIERDFDALAASSEDDEILGCFDRNPQSCTKYFGCPYHSFCCSWPNPLRNLEVPIGFKVSYWNPLERPAREVFRL